jgi:hypothetical protein
MLHDSDIPWEMGQITATMPRTATSVQMTLADLLHDLRAFIRRYVVLTDDQALAVTLWTAHTHAITAADCTPYLQVTSATKRAGKTRLLEVLEPVVARPWLTGRTSAAALVRKVDVDQPTLLLDESDAAFGGEKEYAEALRGLLNSGYKSSGKASLCIGKGADLSVRDFSTFSAKAIAGIGKLPDTIADRAIPIILRRRMATEPVQRWRERDGRADAAPLHRQLFSWSGKTVDVLRAARPSLPSELSDRAADVWEPLLAIADLAGGDWPGRARRAAVALMGGAEDTDPVIELLTDINDIIVNDDISTDMIPTKDLLEKLVAREDRPWATWRRDKPITAHGLARLLGPLGIHPDRRRIGGIRHWSYRRDAFADAIARYLPIEMGQRDNSNKNGHESRPGCVSGEVSKIASGPGFQADFTGSVPLSHMDRGDTDDGRY